MNDNLYHPPSSEVNAPAASGRRMSCWLAFAGAIYPFALMTVMIGTWGTTSWIIGHPAVPWEDSPSDAGNVISLIFVFGQVMILLSGVALPLAVILQFIVTQRSVGQRLMWVLCTLAGWGLFYTFWEADPYMIVFWFWD